MSFDIDNLWVITIGGTEVWITRTVFNTWMIMLFLIGFAVFARIKLRRLQEIPKGFQNAVEAVVELFDGFLQNTVGEKLMHLGPWFFMVFALVFSSSVGGILGLRSPTTDWAMTFALALATFILIQITGVRYRKAEYLKSFFSPNPVFLPLNLIGELARPISLSFRLFGNALAGMILMSLLYSITPVFARFGIPAVLHAYFDLLTGALQTYIFCVLSLMFIKQAAE